jgi:outer membrane protein OmpA-like peptidoglycan-associated protein
MSIRFLLLFLLSAGTASLSAQDCADLYFYRINSVLQKDTTIFLMRDGQPLTIVNLGDRYHATVCEPQQLEFVVKLGVEDVIYDSHTVDIQPGNDYYFRIGVSMALYVPAMKEMEEKKALRDLDKGGKFIGAMQELDLNTPMQYVATDPPPYGGGGSSRGGGGSYGGGPAGGQDINAPVVMNNFRFEMVERRKSGELVEMDFKITNLAPTDRVLESCGDMTSIYDDLGNFYQANEMCIAQSCGKGIWYTNGIDQFRCREGVRAKATLPSGIPMNAKVVIPDVDRRAKKFLRANWILQSVHQQEFEIQYGEINFPDGIDTDNPRRQIAGKQTFEVISAQRKGEQVYVKVNAFNRDVEPYPLTVMGGTAYDDRSSVLPVTQVSMGNDRNPTPDTYRTGWQQSIPAVESLPFFLVLNEVPRGATELLRLDVNFGDYELRWPSIPITGEGGRSSQSTTPATTTTIARGPAADYMDYEEFKEEAKNKERVIDKRVILDNIYFDSGSDDLLSTSHSQLDDLAATLTQYPDLNIEISGHTDNVGGTTSNMLLSQKRADAVKYYLISHTVAPTRMESVGHGDTLPIASNETSEGKQGNRRVEIRVVR